MKSAMKSAMSKFRQIYISVLIDKLHEQ